MLDSETKSRIDTARGILVGKIPNPQAQVEQITIAMIYKFMDDMDRQVEEAGGKRKFFSGTYSRYSWQHLMSPKLGGLEVLNLYSDAIQKMDLNPNIPLLFREIFKNAYLPYKDPETLRSFLKTINGFTYDHSERLGDAFEYLLSILGSQGDAGQFRTPRHIIDFMVYITDPQKGESILDPACGTAGFLISSYKHILKNNSSEYLKKIDHSFSFGSENGESSSGDKLTPDDRRKLPKNIRGYDISPDMVRLSLVNLYLHGFAEPNIFEYDTLTSEDKWNEYYNVILANPPFMSPKGGIRPHKRFSIESNRSEVLFVDYIAEHLTQFGRAAVIVPEGIIFQSGTAYKFLRKMLVENHLYAVVSLPAGVFNPYSGVKTSILLMDKTLSKRTENILFAKVENDGFDLGAQRRANDKSELPQTAKAIKEYKESLLTGKNFPVENYPNLLLAPKSKISESGDYNLSGERYREGIVSMSTFPMVELSKICELVRGVVFTKNDEVLEGGLKVLRANNINKDTSQLNLEDIKQVSKKIHFADEKKLKQNDIFICLASGSKDHIGKVTLIKENTDYYFGGFMGAIRVNTKMIKPEYLLRQLTSGHFNSFLRDQIAGANINNLSSGILYRFQIPLPPLEVQKEIVAEIEGYQKIIDGARQIVDNYKPRINIDPKWEVVKLGELISLEYGKPLKTENRIEGDFPVYGSNGIVGYHNEFLVEGPTVIVGRKGSAGAVNYSEFSCYPIDTTFYVKVKDQKKLNLHYCYYQLCVLQLDKVNTQSGVPGLNRNDAYQKTIPVPPIETQREIVSRIEREQELVNANKELIKIFESKIKSKISSVWGEESE